MATKAQLEAQVAELQAQNAALQARLDKAVETNVCGHRGPRGRAFELIRGVIESAGAGASDQP